MIMVMLSGCVSHLHGYPWTSMIIGGLRLASADRSGLIPDEGSACISGGVVRTV